MALSVNYYIEDNIDEKENFNGVVNVARRCGDNTINKAMLTTRFSVTHLMKSKKFSKNDEIIEINKKL